MTEKPRHPGIRVIANGNQLVSFHTETRVAGACAFNPITIETLAGRNHVIVLERTEEPLAIAAEHVDEVKVEVARAVATVNASLARSLVQLPLKRRRRR